MSCESQDIEMTDNTSTCNNIQIEGDIVEYYESDFSDVMTQQANIACDLQKKDNNSGNDRSRKQFDSADYWMNKQQEQVQK
jgi:hypothetical protein